MKRRNYFILLLIVGMLFSCKPIIFRMSGLRMPKIENKKSVFKFLKKIKQDTNDVYTLDTLLFNKFRSTPFKPGWPKDFRPAQIRTYNKNGTPVMQWASCEGFLKDLKTFDSLPPKNVNELNVSQTLQEDLSQYFTLDGKLANIIKPDWYDYYILVYFALYFPKMSKESFDQITNYKRIHSDIKIKVYKINVDFQAFWGIEPEVIVDKK